MEIFSDRIYIVLLFVIATVIFNFLVILIDKFYRRKR